jgi:hypothetical protein
MSDIEQYQRGLQRTSRPVPPVQAASWRQAKQAKEEKFETQSRVVNGADITECAQEGLERIRRRLASQLAYRDPDDLDMLFLQAYSFGAAERIQEYMQRPCGPSRRDLQR